MESLIMPLETANRIQTHYLMNLPNELLVNILFDPDNLESLFSLTKVNHRIRALVIEHGGPFLRRYFSDTDATTLTPQRFLQGIWSASFQENILIDPDQN